MFDSSSGFQTELIVIDRGCSKAILTSPAQEVVVANEVYIIKCDCKLLCHQ